MRKKVDYRRRFLKGRENHTFLCRYCLTPVHGKTLRVDHKIPQNVFRKIKDFLLLLMCALVGVRFFVKLNISDTYYSIIILMVQAVLYLLILLTLFVRDCKFNLQPTCATCNSKKSDKLFYRFSSTFFKRVVKVFVSRAMVLGVLLLLVVTVYYMTIAKL